MFLVRLLSLGSALVSATKLCKDDADCFGRDECNLDSGLCSDPIKDGHIVDVFSPEEVRKCGKIRIPQMTVTPKGILLLGQCRYANDSLIETSEPLHDDQRFAKVVTKFSVDNGTTWSAMQFLTPNIGYSHGQVIYDRLRNQVVLQYQHHPNQDPTLNSTLYQRISTDCCGQNGIDSWGQERDITSLVKRCNPSAPKQMQVLLRLFKL